jgi:hypothetical protein
MTMCFAPIARRVDNITNRRFPHSRMPRPMTGKKWLSYYRVQDRIYRYLSEMSRNNHTSIEKQENTKWHVNLCGS